MLHTNVRHPEERPNGARLEGRTALPQLPPVIGHRGAAGRAPENTLAGLRRAKALGCRWVEFDVRLTGDGIPVLCHDPRLDRTTNGTGPVAAQTISALREHDAGSWFAPEFAGERIPTLAEALRLASELHLGANIEIKAARGREYATAAAVAAALDRRQGGAPSVLVSSFQLPAMTAMRQLAPAVPRGMLFRLVPRDWADIARRLDCAAIGADHRRLRRRGVEQIRAAGYQLAAYTVNDPARARLLYGWGVTSVFSDVPDIILNLTAGHGTVPTGAVAPRGPAPARQGAFR